MGKYATAIVSCIFLIALTFIGFTISLKTYLNTTQVQFEQLSEERVTAIRRALNTELLIMESMRSMYAVYNGRPQPQFGSFVQPFEDEIPGIQALQWIAPVPQDERELFELARQNEGITGFQITERSPDGMVRAGQRDLYYPVYPVLPIDPGEESIGFDLGSDPVRSAALQEAVRTGNFTASARVSLLQAEQETEYGFLVFAPLYSQETGGLVIPEDTLLGLVTGIFRISDIVDDAISQLDFEAIDLMLEDESPDSPDTYLYQYQVPRDDDTGNDGDLFSPNPYNATFDFAGRQWSVTSTPAPGYMATRPATTSWTILALGLMTSLLLTLYLVLNMRQSNRIRDAEIRRQELERLLIHTQKMETLGSLVGGIAHDFNNILTSVLGYSELAMLHGHEQGDDDLDQYLKNINSGANRGKNLIQKLLAFSRSTHSEPALVDIKATVENTLELIGPLISRHVNVTLDCDENGPLPKVKIDPTSMDQLLVNLCVNARDAIDGAGEIRITLRHKALDDSDTCSSCDEVIRGDYISIAVADSGEGIQPELMDNIFKPFFTTKEPGKGTGMGLSIINSIVHTSGGHILVNSEPGRGTTFDLLLPVAEG